MYNVTTDHGFPFFLYSAQQDSGTVATPIFGRGGQITYRDWYTTNGFESARLSPDPADPNYLYATGWYGSILRVNKTTGQTQHIFERTPKYHESGSPPMGFSPFDPNTFYLATQYLLATHDKGMHWENGQPRPDGRPAAKELGTAPIGNRAGRGATGPAISSLAFSPKDGESDLGRHQQWSDPTDSRWRRALEQRRAGETAAGGAVTAMEASRQRCRPRFRDGRRSAEQVVAADAAELPPPPPRLYRTDDYGKNWKLVNAGLPNSALHAVREDHENRNLVFRRAG